MKKIATFLAIVVLAASGIFTAIALADNPGNSNAGNKVTLCHATGSSTNPFVEITVNANGAVNGHAGSSHQDGRDIIPPFSYNDHGKTQNFPGQNYDARGKALLANGCKPVSTTTSTTTTTGTTTTGSTTTVPGSTVTGPSVTVPGSTVTGPSVTVPGSTVIGPTTTVPGKKTTKPPAKKHQKPKAKPHLPKPPKQVKEKPRVFPYTP